MISTYRPRSSFVMRSSRKLTLPLIINFYEWRLCIVQCKIYWILVSDLKLVLFTIGRKLLGDIMQNSLLVRKEKDWQGRDTWGHARQCTSKTAQAPCKLITSQNKSHGEIIRVCMGIFTMLWVIVVAPRNLQTAESHCLAYLSRTFHQVTHY